MTIQPSFTPEQVMKTIDSVIATQRKSGYKSGWVAFEMKRRCDDASARLSAYSQACKSELPGLAMEIVNGEIARDEAINWLNERYENWTAGYNAYLAEMGN